MDDQTQNPDETLDRAVAALRGVTPPDGPSASLAQRTAAALRDAARNVRLARSSTRQSLFLRIAAAVVIGLCAAAIIHGVMHKRRQLVIDRGSTAPVPRATPAPQSHIPPRPVAPAPASHHQAPVAVAPPPPSTPRPVALASGVSIAGHVYFHGLPPPPQPIDTRICPECARVIPGPIYDESLVVNEDSALENVVVSISAGLPPGERFPTPPEPVVLDQKYCTFQPHVVAAMIDQPVIVRNSDPILHNVRSLDADDAPAFDFAQPTIGQRQIQPIRVVETFKVKCNLHPWMSAWVRTFDHPYFDVTRGDGTFSIRDLPPGTYRLKAWHERLGVLEKTVTVTSGEPAVVDFTFEPR